MPLIAHAYLTVSCFNSGLSFGKLLTFLEMRCLVTTDTPCNRDPSTTLPLPADMQARLNQRWPVC